MEKNNQGVNYVQDVLTQDPNFKNADLKNGLPVPNVENIEKWLTEDIQRAMGVLNAILQDKDLRHQMAIWFTGKIENARHKPEPVSPFSKNGVS